MLKKYFLLIFVVIILMTAVGCRNYSAQGDQEVGFDKLTVIDHMGREVNIESKPMRIVSLAPSNTEILFALGLGDRVVGITEWCNYPEETAGIPKVGSFKDINMERLVELEPDLILATTMHEIPVKEMENIGVPSIVIAPENIEQIFETMALIANVTREQEKGNEVISLLRDRVNKVVEKTQSLTESQRPIVYYEVWNEPVMTIGPGSFIHDLIAMAGGKNVAWDSSIPYPQISVELIVERNPDVIIHSYHGSQMGNTFSDRKGWEDITAVKEDKILAILADKINRPGPRIVESLEIFAKFIQPDLFQ